MNKETLSKIKYHVENGVVEKETLKPLIVDITDIEDNDKEIRFVFAKDGILIEFYDSSDFLLFADKMTYSDFIILMEKQK